MNRDFQIGDRVEITDGDYKGIRGEVKGLSVFAKSIGIDLDHTIDDYSNFWWSSKCVRHLSALELLAETASDVS